MKDYTQYFTDGKSLDKDAPEELKDLVYDIHKELCSVDHLDQLEENPWIIWWIWYEFDRGDERCYAYKRIACDKISLLTWLQNDFAFSIYDKYKIECDNFFTGIQERIYETKRFCVEVIFDHVSTFLHNQREKF